jgi:hypothetical protein
MNVFDDEMGPLTDQETARYLVMMAEAGCTPAEALAGLPVLGPWVN